MCTATTELAHCLASMLGGHVQFAYGAPVERCESIWPRSAGKKPRQESQTLSRPAPRDRSPGREGAVGKAGLLVKQLSLFAGIPTPAPSWKQLREQVLREEPVCQICRRAPSTLVHHKVPVTLGGTNARDNLEGLCQDCHSVLPV